MMLKFSVDLNIMDDLLVYVYYVYGFWSGGILIRGVLDVVVGFIVDDFSYELEIVKMIEFGMKL